MSWNLGRRRFTLRSADPLRLVTEAAFAGLLLAPLLEGVELPDFRPPFTLGVKLRVLWEGDPLELLVEVISRPLRLLLTWPPLEVATLVRGWRPRPDILGFGQLTQFC